MKVILGSMITSVIALLLATYLQIFKFPTLAEGLKFEIYLVIYTGFISGIVQEVKKKFFTEIKVVFSEKKGAKDEHVNPEIAFIEDNCNFYYDIYAKGSYNRLKKMKLTINFPTWIDVQTNQQTLTSTQNETEKSITLSIASLLSGRRGLEKVSSKDCKIILIKNIDVEEVIDLEIKCELLKDAKLHEKIMCSLTTNYMTLKSSRD